MGKIIFFEDRNFQGRSYECSSDCSDLHPFFTRCNSIRVENGNWMLYERPNFAGHQYFLKKGEYPDFRKWLGFNDSIRSVRLVSAVRSHKIRVYEREDFRGEMLELSEDCPTLFEQFNYLDVLSCNVIEGSWIFYELPNYRGKQYFLKQGEYRRFTEWGALNSKVGSLKRILDSY
ncbi:gamma-crystallin 2-like [Bombina bombina]|uniref:gamma-crystallin 2-like n=1 Tax=Bombina bombina TaxID=8345 RepID=UPI00235ADD7A|nr:gamma-crystallin 2-like [Bombina bombina]